MGEDEEEYESPAVLLSSWDSGDDDDMDNVVVGFLVIAAGDCQARAIPANPSTAEKSIIVIIDNRIVADSCLSGKIMGASLAH
jgi:hypothetical protein